MTRQPETHTDCVDEIVSDQAGGDGEGKLSKRRGHPRMLPSRHAAATMGRVPPAVGKAYRNREGNNKRKPTAGSVEEFFPFNFPPGQSQAEQTENGSYCHASKGKPKSWPEPERHQEGNAKKKHGRKAGHPNIYSGDPAPALPSRGAGAVTQCKGEQHHAAKSEHDKKEKGKENNRHGAMLARST